MRVLDEGIYSDLPTILFAKTGLKISGMDFSSIMLDIRQAKRNKLPKLHPDSLCGSGEGEI